MLTAVARQYAGAGVTVLGREALTSGPGEDTVLVLDDADQLDEPSLAAVRKLLARREARMILARRPGTAADLGPVRELVLGALNPDQVALLARELLGRDAGLPALHASTGGIPRFVARLLAAGSAVKAVESFRSELAALSADQQGYLVAAEAGAARDLGLLCAVLDRDREGVSALIGEVRATGLLGTDDGLPPLVALAVRTLVVPDRRLGVLTRMLEVRAEDGEPVLGLARSLLDTGASGRGVTAAYAAAASEALPDDPELAAALFAAAAGTGRPRAAIAPGWAQAAARTDDFGTALVLGDELLGAADPGDRARGAVITGTVLGRRGELARSAELLLWSGEESVTALAAVELLAAGRRAEADEALASVRSPSALLGVTARMAEGVRASIDGHPSDALSTLLTAAATLETAHEDVLLPVFPAEPAALLALHTGELALAEDVLGRARPTVRTRLLLAWTALLRGDLPYAERQIAAVDDPSSLTPRDELYLTTAELGLARRQADLPGMRHHGDRAYAALMRQPVDLFTLIPLSELATSAARLRRHDRISGPLDRADRLLERLGNPPNWTAWLHWGRLHAAILAADRDTAEHQLKQLDQCAPAGRFAAALATAGRCWLALLGGPGDGLAVAGAAPGPAGDGGTAGAFVSGDAAGSAGLGGSSGIAGSVASDDAADAVGAAESDVNFGTAGVNVNFGAAEADVNGDASGADVSADTASAEAAGLGVDDGAAGAGVSGDVVAVEAAGPRVSGGVTGAGVRGDAAGLGGGDAPGEPGSDRPAAGGSVTGKSAIGVAATGAPTTGAPASGEPATDAPATGVAASGGPATGAAASGSPATGVPARGVAASGVPATGAPATGAPATGVAATGVAARGVAASGGSATGVAATGVPASGVAATGVTASGGPATGVAASGGPATGGPGAGVEAVLAAAGELHELGFGWDAARLAGQAAVRTADRGAMVRLLNAAKSFQHRGPSAAPVVAEAVSPPAALSEREEEVARLVVDGFTYKQAGEKLFISSKTVEHHMARVRAKLKVGDRRELLQALRRLFPES